MPSNAAACCGHVLPRAIYLPGPGLHQIVTLDDPPTCLTIGGFISVLYRLSDPPQQRRVLQNGVGHGRPSSLRPGDLPLPRYRPRSTYWSVTTSDDPGYYTKMSSSCTSCKSAVLSTDPLRMRNPLTPPLGPSLDTWSVGHTCRPIHACFGRYQPNRNLITISPLDKA